MRVVMVVVLAGLASIAGCSSSGVVSTGVGTNMVAKTGRGLGESGAEVAADLYREAAAFCAAKGMEFERVSVDAQDWRAFVRFASAQVEFKCISKAQ